MNKTVLIIGIIFLLIGASVVSSMKTVENKDNKEEKLSRGKIAYGCCSFSPYNIVKFPLDDPSNIEIIGPGDNTYFLPGGTWSYEHGWFACEYNSGGLWLIDPETGWMENIGGGGVCSELAWDDWTSELYSACIQGLAFNSEGICYGIDGYGSDYYLYIVDFDPYEEYLEILFIPFFLFFMYTLIAKLDLEKLQAGEAALKQALERAESEQSKSNAVLAAIGDGISIQDRDLTIVYQNEIHKKSRLLISDGKFS